MNGLFISIDGDENDCFIIIILFVHKNNFMKTCNDSRQHANRTDKASLALTVAPLKKKKQLLSLWMIMYL